MKVTDFNKLSIAQKTDMVWEWGYFITSNNYGDHTIAIFYLSGFFIEMRISVKEDKTESIIGHTKEQIRNQFPGVVKEKSLFVKRL